MANNTMTVVQDDLRVIYLGAGKYEIFFTAPFPSAYLWLLLKLDRFVVARALPVQTFCQARKEDANPLRAFSWHI